MHLFDDLHGPRFENSSYSVTIDQDTRLYTVVYTGIEATDPDGGKVHYFFVDDKNSTMADLSPTFSICNQTGHVILLRPLDINYQSYYKLKIKVIGCQQFAAFAYLSIWITRNGTGPTIPDDEAIQFQFFPGNASLHQNHMNETLIFKVVATSIFNDVLHYELMDTLNGSITINSTTGEITTSKLLLWTPAGDFVIHVKAKNSFGAEKVNNFTLIIKEPDLVNSPQFSPFSNITIPMLTGIGSVVATLNATNNYPGGFINYTIFTDTGEVFLLSEIFHIDYNTSTVIISEKPKTPVYDLAVIAYNDKGFITNQKLTIIVDFVGAPAFANTDDADIFLADNTPSQFVANVAAVDPEGSGITYSILDLDTGLYTGVPFSVDVNGDLTTTAELIPGMEFRLMVEAVDAEGKWAIKLVTVTVPGTATNLIPPTFSKTTYAIDVVETQMLYTIFTYITAEDTDTFAPNNILSYFLQTSAEEIFGININNGGLYLKQVPSPGVYTLTVSARDQGIPSMVVFVTFNITITAQVINHMPVFTSSNVLTSRTGDLAADGVVGTIVVTDDSDAGSVITYSINSRVTSDTHLFSIGSLTGILTTNQVLVERSTPYLITVTATDNGSPSFSIHLNLQIFIFAVPTRMLTFTNFNGQSTISEAISVSENLPADTVLLDLSTNINGSTTTPMLTYLFTAGNSFGEFKIENNQLRTNMTFDREVSGFYLVTVTVSDDGSPPAVAVATVQINILDVNDIAPVFEYNYYVFQIADTVTSEVIGSVAALDGDIGDNGKLVYSIAGGADSSKFQIDSTTAAISLLEALVANTNYSFSVTAQDSGVPPLSATVDVTVVVRFLINPAPQFTGAMTFSIVEDVYSQGSAVVGNVQVTDDNPPVTISIMSGDPSNRFSFTGTSLNVVGDLDRETISVYQLALKAVDSGTSPSTGTGTVTIQVIDANDNSPQFTRSTYSFITYDDVIGDPIGSLSASDLDSAGPNRQISYLIETSADSSKFQIDANTATIRAGQALQGNTNYALTVRAQDAGSPVMSSTADVTIAVLSRANPGPQFSGTFNYSITEGSYSTSSRTIATITATSAFMPIQYIITSGDPSVKFLLTGSSITVVDDLDRETLDIYHLIVTAIDSASPPATSTATFTVHVTDVNDNSPEFNQTTYSITIFTDTSGVIGYLSATDRDTGSNALLGYSLASAPTYFSVAPSSGAISAAPPIPVGNYLFAADVTDNYGIFSSTALSARSNVRVTVVENNLPPAFDALKYQFFVREDAVQDVSIGNVTATDVDFNAISYFLLFPTTVFRIDLASGTLFVAEPLDRELIAQYTFPVYAIDDGSPSKTGVATIEVNILDVNDNYPSFNLTEDTFLIQDDNTLNVSFGSVLAEDPDDGLNGMVLYSLFHANFDVNPVTGALSLTSPVTPQTFNLNVTASDGGHPSLSTWVSVQVIVTNASNPIPAFTGPMSFTINENTPRDTLVANITTNRPGVTTISFSLVGTTIFRIDASGSIFIIGDLDREVSERITFTVIAIDSAPPPVTASATVIIDIGDLNDNTPKFNQTEYEFLILDTRSINDVIGSVSAFDIDQNANSIVSYFMTPSSPFFSMNAQSGAVTLLAAPPVKTYFFTVKASDSGNPSLSSSVDVRIVVSSLTPINNGPTFTGSLSFSVEENSANGVEFGTISVSDPDQPVTCSQPGSSLFTVSSSCTIFTAGFLDREVRDTYSIVVVAVDSGSPVASSTATVIIQVLDVNDNSPVFDTFSSPISIPATLTSGQLIATLGARDADIGFSGSIVYDNSNGLDGFDVNSGNGQIKWTGNIIPGIYTLQVGATDQGTPARSTTAFLTINVVSGTVNSPPTFDFGNYNAIVREDASLNHVVTTMIATGTSVTYSITSGNTGGDFDIRPDSGEVIVNAALDFEINPTYTLGIRATDGASLIANTLLTITVTDINENAPEFDQQSYSASVTSTTVVGEVILTVHASDADGDKVNYFPNGNGINFNVDSETGEVTLLTDNLAIGTYSFSVYAIDDGKTAEYSVVNVIITVTS